MSIEGPALRDPHREAPGETAWRQEADPPKQKPTVKVEQFLEELRVAIFLAGGRSVADLHVAGRVILGETPRWIDDHGYGVDGV